MRPTKTLRVLPNPWLHIHVYPDGTACPVAAVGVDMVEHVPSPNRYVGARIAGAVETTPRKTMTVGKLHVVRQRARHEISWEFATEPETIPNTGYYRDQLQARALIAADAESAGAAGIKFRDPAEVLEEERSKAIAAFEAAHGAGSWADQGCEPDAIPPLFAPPKVEPEASATTPAPAPEAPAKTTKRKD